MTNLGNQMAIPSVLWATRSLLALAIIAAPAAAVVGQPAPGFTLTDIDGNTFTLSSQVGKVVLLDFFATTCGPCTACIPAFKELLSEFSDDLVIVSISVWPSDTLEMLKEFRTDEGVTWRILRDTTGAAASLYGVGPIPHLFIVSRTGVLSFSRLGYSENIKTILRNAILPLVQQSVGTSTQLTLALSVSTVDVGTVVGVSGSLTPAAAGVGILIRVTKPDGSTTTLTTSTSAGGTYSTTHTPDGEGIWRYKAVFAGDALHMPSESAEATLTAKAPFPWVLAGGAALVVVLIAGGTWLLISRRAEAGVEGPPPPPPPPPDASDSLAVPPAGPPPPRRLTSAVLRNPVPLALSGVFLLAVALGFESEYGIIQAFVRFLCLSCVGIG